MGVIVAKFEGRSPGQLKRFPDFGAELKRPYEVHEWCYDCEHFLFGDCPTVPASEEFNCKTQEVRIVEAGLIDWHEWVYGGKTRRN